MSIVFPFTGSPLKNSISLSTLAKVLKLLQSDFAGQVFLVGRTFHKISPESGFKTFVNVDKLIEFLKNEPVTGNTILIKGSRGIKLERIYDLL